MGGTSTDHAALEDLSLPEHQARVSDAVDAAIGAVGALGYEVYGTRLGDIEAVATLHALSPDLQRSVVIDLAAQICAQPTILNALRLGRRSAGRTGRYYVERILATFSSKRIPYTMGDATILLTLSEDTIRNRRDDDMATMPATIAALERVATAGRLAAFEPSVKQLIDALDRHDWDRRKANRLRTRLAAMLSQSHGALDPDMLSRGDSWGAKWHLRLPEIPTALHPLLIHLPTASAVDPTQKWKARAREVAAIPGARGLLLELLEDVEATQAMAVPGEWGWFIEDVAHMPVPYLEDRNAQFLRGVIWAAALSGGDDIAERLVGIGLVCGTSATGNNEAREERIANTVAAALGGTDSEAAITALGRLKAKVTNRNVSKQIAKALDGAAARRGTSPSELLELAVPTLGFGPEHRAEIPVSDVTAAISLAEDGALTLVWRESDGTERANPPKRVAEDAGPEVRRVKDSVKDARKAVAAERGRVEDLFADDREWDLATWRTRYLDHPLTSVFGRRLIWRISTGDADGWRSVLPDGDALIDADGNGATAGRDARVRLWHPIDATEAEIAMWRSTVMARRIRQPFKQAFREVYRLAPAEEETEVYSNRFAGHILAYNVARALMSGRRWASNFLGPFDGGYDATAKRDFPSHSIQAQFFHDAVENAMDGYTVAYCATDQVRFVRLARGRAEAVIPLRDVPPIVFSEAMRDVDLFVGVSSVGADTNWADAGRDRQEHYARMGVYFDGYWDRDLTASASVRRDALARMLPGLVIADRTELQDRWLRVHGKLRTYRIHLGSGNVLMEPSDTYLCIVPARGAAAKQKVFLPFDDDPLLGLILSKAFLLADDVKIADDTIVRQIRSG